MRSQRGRRMPGDQRRERGRHPGRARAEVGQEPPPLVHLQRTVRRRHATRQIGGDRRLGEIEKRSVALEVEESERQEGGPARAAQQSSRAGGHGPRGGDRPPPRTIGEIVEDPARLTDELRMPTRQAKRPQGGARGTAVHPGGVGPRRGVQASCERLVGEFGSTERLPGCRSAGEPVEEPRARRSRPHGVGAPPFEFLRHAPGRRVDREKRPERAVRDRVGGLVELRGVAGPQSVGALRSGVGEEMPDERVDSLLTRLVVRRSRRTGGFGEAQVSAIEVREDESFGHPLLQS